MIIIIIIIIIVTRILIQGESQNPGEYSNACPYYCQLDGMRSHLFAGLTDAFAVAMEQWTVAHRAFVILKGGDSPWSARSSDLSVCNYFLWGYLESRCTLRHHLIFMSFRTQ